MKSNFAILRGGDYVTTEQFLMGGVYVSYRYTTRCNQQWNSINLPISESRQPRLWVCGIRTHSTRTGGTLLGVTAKWTVSKVVWCVVRSCSIVPLCETKYLQVEETLEILLGNRVLFSQFFALSVPSACHLTLPYIYVSTSFLCQDTQMNHITIVQLAQFNLQEPCVLYIGRAYRYPPDVAFCILFFNKYRYWVF
jgi:hypothetical protein